MSEQPIPEPMDTLNNLFGGGWSALEEKQQQAGVEARQAAYDKALIIATPFRSSAGKLALDALRKMTLFAPTWDAESRDALSAAAYGFTREGQNSIIRHIERCIAVVDEGPPK